MNERLIGEWKIQALFIGNLASLSSGDLAYMETVKVFICLLPQVVNNLKYLTIKRLS